jgi:hypothetical protein
MVKWVGAVFTFLPGRLGLIKVVTPQEVMRVDMSASPTSVVFISTGRYALFTANYDLLAINEAVLAAKAKPWFRLTGSGGDQVAIALVERGLAVYDTPLASGRPVARFEIAHAGSYTMTHPSRRDFAFIVPDYSSGEESTITFFMLAQAAALGAAGWYVRKRTKKPLTKIVAPPPSRLSRERFKAEQPELEPSPPRSVSRPWSGNPVPAMVVSETEWDPNARDVLRLAQAEQLTAQQAEAEVEALMSSQPAGASGAGWGTPLALTPFETAAYAQGASIGDLLKLRYTGWPTSCIKCGQPIDYHEVRWWFMRDEIGEPALRHIECPPGSRSS